MEDWSQRTLGARTGAWFDVLGTLDASEAFSALTACLDPGRLDRTSCWTEVTLKRSSLSRQR